MARFWVFLRTAPELIVLIHNTSIKFLTSGTYWQFLLFLEDHEEDRSHGTNG